MIFVCVFFSLPGKHAPYHNGDRTLWTDWIPFPAGDFCAACLSCRVSAPPCNGANVQALTWCLGGSYILTQLITWGIFLLVSVKSLCLCL